MLNAESKELHIARIKALFEGNRPTFIRRDKDYFNSVKTLEKQAQNALDKLPNLSAVKDFISAVNRTYALCVTYEIRGIEKLKNSNIPKCKVKLKEAEVFYRIIKPEIAKKDRKTDQEIETMFSLSYDKMNSKILNEKISEIINM